MNFKINEYEIEVKAKDTILHDRFTKSDTECALTELSLILFYAREYMREQSGKDDEPNKRYFKMLEEKTTAIMDTLDSVTGA